MIGNVEVRRRARGRGSACSSEFVASFLLLSAPGSAGRRHDAVQEERHASSSNRISDLRARRWSYCKVHRRRPFSDGERTRDHVPMSTNTRDWVGNDLDEAARSALNEGLAASELWSLLLGILEQRA